MKGILLPVLTFIISISVSAQGRFMHSVGATISVLDGNDKETDSWGNTTSNQIMVVQTNVSYFPRYNLLEMPNSSLSVGMPVGAGIGIFENQEASDVGIGFAFDIPVVVDYNIGCKSTNSNEKNFGGYFGLGFGYYNVQIKASQYSNFNGSTYGPMFRSGIRFGSGSWGGQAVTFGLFYKMGIEKTKFSTYGANIYLDL